MKKILVVVDMQNDLFLTACACVTRQSHDTAIHAMETCQIDIRREGTEE